MQFCKQKTIILVKREQLLQAIGMKLTSDQEDWQIAEVCSIIYDCLLVIACRVMAFLIKQE